MKQIIFILFAFQTHIIGQTLDQDYEWLAKYSILKYALDKNFLGNTSDGIRLPRSIEDVEEIIKNKNYKYSVDSIYSFNEFQIISITDESNFQLHGLNFNVYAIDTTETFGDRYYSLESNNFLEYINSNLYKFPRDSTERIKLIEVYNALLKCFNRYGSEIIFYNEENKSSFQYLSKRYRFTDLMEDNVDYIYNLYYTTNINGDIEFRMLFYEFKKDKMEIVNRLEYKIISEDERYKNPEH